VKAVLKDAQLPPEKRVKTLTDEEINRISKVIEKGYTVEGDLRRQVHENIKRLIEIRSYRVVGTQRICHPVDNVLVLMPVRREVRD